MWSLSDIIRLNKNPKKFFSTINVEKFTPNYDNCTLVEHEGILPRELSDDKPFTKMICAGVTYNIHFRHWIFRKPVSRGKGKKRGKGYTFCVITEENNWAGYINNNRWVGATKCSIDDNFSRETGRLESLLKALTSFGLIDIDEASLESAVMKGYRPPRFEINLVR